jgi:hypothetical protein
LTEFGLLRASRTGFFNYSPQEGAGFLGVCVAPMSSLTRVGLGLFVPALSMLLLGANALLHRLASRCVASPRVQWDGQALVRYGRTLIALLLTSYQQVFGCVRHCCSRLAATLSLISLRASLPPFCCIRSPPVSSRYCAIVRI